MSILKKLLNDTLWISLGQLSVSIAGFLLVPLYTAYLDPEAYGILDIINVTILFLLPIVTCQSGDAIQTFLLKKEEKKETVFSNSIFILGIVWCISLLFFPIFYSYLTEYTYFLYGLLLLQGITKIFFSYFKGTDNVKVTGLVSAVETFSLVLLMFLVLYYLELGLKGYFIALLITRFISVSIYVLTTPFWKVFDIKTIKFDIVKKVLIFSLPLIPNMLGWWVNNLSDRYIISYIMGVEFNGIYAIAAKFPSLLSILSSIVISSWMITSLKNYNKKNDVLFRNFSKIFSLIILFFSLAVIIFLDPIFNLYIQSDAYSSALNLIPLLLLAAVFSAVSSLYGIVYLGEKDTKLASYTTIVSGISNVLLNLILIPVIGMFGAVLATFVSFSILVLMRYKYVKKHTSLSSSILVNIIIIALAVLYSLNLMFSGLQEIIDIIVIISMIIVFIRLSVYEFKYKYFQNLIIYKK